MSANAKTNDQNKGDFRPDAIGQVWWAALAMLAICIPLGAVLKSGAIPLVVIGGAVLATMYVWKTNPQKTSRAEDEAETLRAKIRELEERLANVEIINSFEERLAERSLVREEETEKAREPGHST